MDPTRITDELAAIEGRRGCTDAERRAARALARHVKALGRRARIETHWVRPQWPQIWLLHAVLGIAASVVSTGSAAVGLGIAAVAAVSALAELNGRIALLSLLWPRRATQDVVSAGVGDAPVRLLVTAAYDAPRERTALVRGLGRADGAIRTALGGHWPHPLALLALALIGIAACAGVRLGGAEGTAIGAVQLVPTAVCIVAVAVLADLSVARTATGRNANAGAAAIALALVEALERRAPHRLAVDLVLAGASDGPALGFRAHVRAHRRATRAEEVAVLHVEAPGDGKAVVWTHAGPLLEWRMHPRLVALAADAGGARVRTRSTSAALEARRARWPAVAIGARDGSAPDPEAVDPAALGGALQLGLSLARALDRDLAGRSS